MSSSIKILFLRLFLSYLCLFIWPYSSFGAETSSEKTFEQLERHFKLQPFFDFPSYSYYFGAPDINGYAYIPNFSPRLGLTVGWKQFEIGFGVGLPIPDAETYRRGTTEQSNLMIQTRWRKTAYDFYLQSYRGLYASNPLTEFDGQRPDRYTQFPDAKVNNYGINFYYLLDEESNYSLKAAFNQKEIQRETGGSYFLMPFYNHLDVDTGYRLIPGSDPNSLKKTPQVRLISLETLGLVYGKGHLWVIPESDWYGVIQVGMGPAVQYQRETFINREEGSSTSLAGKFSFNGAFASNTQTSTYGAKMIWETMYSRLGSTDMYSTVVTLTLFYGQRF